MRKLKFTFILLSLFIGSSALMAQMTTSSLSGNITDSNGEGLAGATIVAVHVPSGTQYATFCDKSGNYGIQNMRVGG
ncbi:MAG: carboxypeptidase-like regulatory domain-containing protein, partial [Bacteroidales bacterium]